MSGPIVRKYGFPNFDKIFGERPLQHGREEGEETQATTKPAGQAADGKVPSAEGEPKRGKD